jgi:hypothetical protein
MTKKTETIVLSSIFILIILGYIAFCYFESSTFNRLTGANTTWFDALWVELRVDCNNIKEVNK